MTDIEVIRVLTGNSEISDEFIAFYLESTRDFIKSYCNLDRLPDELSRVCLEITALRVKANASGSSSALGEGIKQVGSITDGNQSISYSVGGAGTKGFVSEEDFVSAYGHMLDRYRRMVVERPCKRHLGARRIKR